MDLSQVDQEILEALGPDMLSLFEDFRAVGGGKWTFEFALVAFHGFLRLMEKHVLQHGKDMGLAAALMGLELLMLRENGTPPSAELISFVRKFARTVHITGIGIPTDGA